MLRNKAVLIVGAGASSDLGLPLGPKLKEDIAKALSYRAVVPDIVRTFQHIAQTNGQPIDSYLSCATFISKNMWRSESIDNFLNNHRNDSLITLIGKIAIAYCVAKSEAGCVLSEDFTDKNLERTDYFLNEFLRIVVRGHTSEDVSESLRNLAFVVYNYDRCVEQYLKIWLTELFGQDLTREIHDNVTFLHVYGSLGELGNSTRFSLRTSDSSFFLNAHLELPKIADRLSIFTEAMEVDALSKVTAIFQDVGLIGFFGFGFEEQNMAILPTLKPAKTPTVVATTFGLSDPNEASIRGELEAKFRARREGALTARVKSGDLIRHFGRAIKTGVVSYSPK